MVDELVEEGADEVTKVGDDLVEDAQKAVERDGLVQHLVPLEEVCEGGHEGVEVRHHPVLHQHHHLRQAKEGAVNHGNVVRLVLQALENQTRKLIEQGHVLAAVTLAENLQVQKRQLLDVEDAFVLFESFIMGGLQAGEQEGQQREHGVVVIGTQIALFHHFQLGVHHLETLAFDCLDALSQ